MTITRVRMVSFALKSFFFIVISFLISCDFNLVESFADKESTDAKLEESVQKIDERNYDDALALLAPLMADSSTDNFKVRILYAAALLGQKGFDIWDIMMTILDDQSSSSNGSGTDSGLDKIFNALTDDTFGTGPVRAARIAALETSIDILKNAPDNTHPDITNTQCFFAGILAVPTMTDTQEAIGNLNTALNELAATSGCVNLDNLTQAQLQVASVTASIDLIQESTSGCSFFNFGSTTAQLNSVEQKMQKLVSAADKGCEEPTCPPGVDCDALFPSCVRDQINSSNGSAQSTFANNGTVESCEFVMHCHNASTCL